MKSTRFTSLEDYTFLKKIENAGTHSIFLEKEQKRIIFKPEDLEKCYRELFYADIYSFLKLPYVEYKLGFRSGFIGVFADDYNPFNYKVKTIDEIIKEYNKEHINQIDYNKNDLERLLEKKYKFFKEKDYLKKQLSLFFIMQIFTANDDFHMGNIEMIHGPNLYFSPFFDFNRCGKIRLKNEFFYKFPYNKGEYNAQKQLISFIKEATNEELETFKFYLEQLKRIEWKSFFETREEQMHAKISWVFKMSLKKEFINNLKEVENISQKK